MAVFKWVIRCFVFVVCLMAKTNLERQREYRERQKQNEGAHRLNGFVSAEAYGVLTKLARHYRITQRELLERLLMDEWKREGGKCGGDDD